MGAPWPKFWGAVGGGGGALWLPCVHWLLFTVGIWPVDDASVTVHVISSCPNFTYLVEVGYIDPEEVAAAVVEEVDCRTVGEAGSGHDVSSARGNGIRSRHTF